MTTKLQSKASMKRENMAELLARGFDFYQATRMQRYAQTLHQLATLDCNVGLTGKQCERRNATKRSADGLASIVGYYVRFNGDPRGWPILLDKDPIADNDTFDKFRVCPY